MITKLKGILNYWGRGEFVENILRFKAKPLVANDDKDLK